MVEVQVDPSVFEVNLFPFAFIQQQFQILKTYLEPLDLDAVNFFDFMFLFFRRYRFVANDFVQILLFYLDKFLIMLCNPFISFYCLFKYLFVGVIKVINR